jgi:hypothetical protein
MKYVKNGYASTGRHIASHMVTNRGLNFRLRGWPSRDPSHDPRKSRLYFEDNYLQ